MRMLRVPALAFALFVAGCAAMPPPVSAPDINAWVAAPEVRLDAERLAADLRFLASDELRGRRAGTPSADVAARYLAEQFRAAGVEPLPSAEDGYFQSVPLPDGAASRNVVGVVRGTDPHLRDE